MKQYKLKILKKYYFDLLLVVYQHEDPRQDDKIYEYFFRDKTFNSNSRAFSVARDR